MDADVKDFTSRCRAHAETKFPCRLISNCLGLESGGSSFSEPQLPAVAEQIALEFELFDGGRKRDIDWHNFDSSNTILNIRACIKNWSRT